MNLTQLSNVLGKIYNTLGNKYLTDNFITEPFEFKVKVRYGTDEEYYRYVIEVYSVPDIPRSFWYKPEVIENKRADGIDITVLAYEFRNMLEYVDGSYKTGAGFKFMNRK
jgi:hypothetical protein